VPNVEQGRIVWANLTSPDGKTTKVLPAVIITPKSELKDGGAFVVVAATSSITKPLPDDHVMLPWHREGKVRTRLNRATAAVCSWLCVINEEDIAEYGGVVPPEALAEILDNVGKSKDDKDR
jgi:mRNA-degrading endonuclease toxin of MazEF toxin-antitoxin module